MFRRRRKAIAESELFWDQLLQLIDTGRVVPIIGPDLLTVERGGIDVPLYPFLAARLAEYLDVPAVDLPLGSEFNEVACRYLAGGNAVEDIYPALKTVMSNMEELAIPSPLLKLAEIRPLRLFVSTTFDDLLERALDQVRADGHAVTSSLAYSPSSWDDLPASSGRKDTTVVYRLFGKLSATPLSYALTQEDVLEYVHMLQSDAHQPSRFFDRMTQDSLLLIGNSFSGWLARFFLRAAKRERFSTVRGSTDYVADNAVRSDDNLIVFLHHFSRGTKVFQGGGAVDFVNELHQRWTARTPTRHEEDDGDKPDTLARSVSRKGAVFLSYASEDLEVARKIYQSLDDAGVEVYFDKSELRSGDKYEHDLRQGISDCSLFIPLISRHTLTEQKRFFRIEWNQALRETEMVPWNKKFIMPIVIDDTPYDETVVPPKMRDLHWAKLENGSLTPDFVGNVRTLYREYQKSLVASQ